MQNNTTTLVATGLTRWLIVTAVMLVAVIEVLDITIVNVALSHMIGALGATQDQITWVITSYIVSAAIVMLLTGFLVDVLGRKKLLLLNIAGFLVSSMLCGAAHSLGEMVLFRVCQGVFGASLIPLSQYILVDTFSKEERNKAMAIWGIGIMVGPILGPTLGGYITDLWNWRWIFFINVPFCTVAFIMSAVFVQETPKRSRHLDWHGMILMALGVGCLQIFLDRGQTEDWLQSRLIVTLLIVGVVTTTLFIRHSLRQPQGIINLRVFADTNFRRSCLVMTIFAMGVFSLLAVQPIMMQKLMGYSAEQAGLVLAPRGITSAIAMALVGRYGKYLDPRWFITCGLLILAFSSFYMSHYNLTVSFTMMATVSLIQGFGVGFFFVPLSTIVFSTLQPAQQAEAAGLFSFARNLGTSLGISLVSTFLARSAQVNWNYLAANLTPGNANLINWLHVHHLTLEMPETIIYFSQEFTRQANMLAFVNAYWLVGLGFLLALPVVWLLKKPRGTPVVMLD